jgi:hypothetical protein
MTQEFKNGDIVCLKSGGPDMTIKNDKIKYDFLYQEKNLAVYMNVVGLMII